jgi:hypothetical protein
MSRLLYTALAAALLASVAGTASTAQAGEPEWIRQFGTLQDDAAAGVAVGPDGRVHVAGYTYGHFGAYKGSTDTLVVTFDRDGNELWRRQPGTTTVDSLLHIATDAAGNVFLVGATDGALGGANKGSRDAFIMAFDRDGRTLWSRQPGTTSYEYAHAVATDAAGNVYVAGTTGGALGGSNQGRSDAFVIKYDHDGRMLWKRQPGTVDSDEATGVATDADGNVYLAGYTRGSLGGAKTGSFDVFLIKFDRDGHALWKRQPGSVYQDYATGVATDGDGNVYVAGRTWGALGGKWKVSEDGFLIKFDRDGRTLWKRQPGTRSYDSASDVATDAEGNVYMVGRTNGSLGGLHMGANDAIVIKYDRDGHNLWRDQPATTGDDWAAGVAVDADGNAYVVGYTSGSLPGYVNLGKADAFLIKYAPGGPR